MMRISAKDTPTNDTDYNCYIKAVELVQPLYEVHITPLVLASFYQVNAKDTPTNNTDYNYYIEAIELI